MMKRLRHAKILELLNIGRAVEVASLCRDFGVTEMTVRRDLDELASRGLLVRTHGGAVGPGVDQNHEQPFDVRITRNTKDKEAIARSALPYMKEGEKIFMNSSSTVFSLARILDNEKSYLIASEATNIANELNTRRHIEVIQIGGELRKNTISCVGFYAEEMIRRFSFDTAFIGINGIDEDGWLYCGSLQETGIYRAIMESASRIIVLADSSKLGRKDFARISLVDEADILITDSRLIPEMKERLAEHDVELIIAGS